MSCLQHNARKAGADAVILLDAHDTMHPYSYYVPGYTTTTPVTTYSSASASYYSPYSGYVGSGNASGVSTAYVPEYHPGYTQSGIAVRTNVNAVMIRFGRSAATPEEIHRHAALGLHFDRGVIVSFQRGSKASEAGLRIGDIVLTVDGIDYHNPRLSDHLASLQPGVIVVVLISS